MKTALLVHGAFGNPNENWFPWLTRELEKFDYKVMAPAFPTPENQNLESWREVVEPHLSELNSESILVGHSIGATFLLSVLENIDVKVAHTLLAAGFISQIGIEEFDAINKTFTEKQFDWDTIRQNSACFSVFHGDDDPYVPKEFAEELAGKLQVAVTWIPCGGHLNESAGLDTFPQMLEVLVN